MDIIQNNLDSRPIYYSVTVPESSRAGLNKFLVFEGLAARVTPFAQPADPTGLGGSIQEERYSSVAYHRPTEPKLTPDRGMFLYSYSDPAAHRSAMDDAYAMTYRFEFIRLASWYTNQSNSAGARQALDTMEARVPVATIDLDYPYCSIVADLAEKAGDWDLARKYAAVGAKSMESIMRDPNWRETDRYAKQISADYEYANLLMKAGRLAEASTKFQTLKSQAPPQQGELLQMKLEEIEARKLETAQDYRGAYLKFADLLKRYRASGAGPAGDLLDMENHVHYDAKRAGITDSVH
jgi:hypothetical protein